MTKKKNQAAPAAENPTPINEDVIGGPDRQMIEEQYAEDANKADAKSAPELISTPVEEVYTFRSRYDMRVVVKTKGHTIPVKFEYSMAVITPLYAQQYGVAPKDIADALKKMFPGYGQDYVQTAGPGFVPTEAVKRFALASAKRASERVDGVISGVRS